MRTAWRVLAASAVVVMACGCAAPKAGILVMAHGGDEEWNAAVERTVAPLREKYPVEIAFGMARSSTMQAAVERLERQGVRRVAVVRLFISGDSFLERTEYILGLRNSPGGAATRMAASGHHGSGARHVAHVAESHHSAGMGHAMEPPAPIQSRCSFVLSRQGVGQSPLVDEILVERVRALSRDPARESVLILAHGPGDDAENERWLAAMRLRAQRICEIGPFRHIEVETLREDWPVRRELAVQRIREYVERAGRDGGRVIVVPFRIAGFGPYAEVLEGLDYVADGKGLCPHPNITRWIEQTARQCLEQR